ncbi:MAG: VIT1/CCC1 transporter family protein [Bacteroidetes bacterium]|nr:VIT1/CCC1 transporter family protein [Bacteroidota bacterium]
MHKEHHFTSSEIIRDIVIGMSDGLTVPFALAAGLSGAVSNNSIIVIAGLAEIAAGSIAMGLGGYLAAKSDAEHYESEKKREEREIVEIPEAEEKEIADILTDYGVDEESTKPFVEALKKNPKRWVDFMMKFELGLEKPKPKRARNSAMTIAGSYIAGGIVPLSPYIFVSDSTTALIISVIVTLMALGIFGYVKGRFISTTPFRKALQTVVTGGLAAGAAFLIAKLIS